MTQARRDAWTTSATGAAGAPPTITRGHARPRAAAPVRRRARRGWLWVLLALLTAAGVLLGLTRWGVQPDAAEPAAAPIPAAPAFPPAGPAPAGSLTAGATSLFDAARAGDRGLLPLVGQTAIAHAVPVQSVAADEGFWIGADETDRVWVQLSTDGESGVTITAGELLDLSGPVVSHGADFARKAGVTADEGAAQLTREGAHLEVDPKQITVSGSGSSTPAAP